MKGKGTSILLTILLVGVSVVLVSGFGTIACFYDIEESIGNIFNTGIWRDGTIYVDVKPGSCPNSINVNSGGVVSIAILGTVDFPVDDLIPTSVRVSHDGIGGTLAPIQCSKEDGATPFKPMTGGGACCHEKTHDGINDWIVHFNKTVLINDLELKQIPHDTTMNVRVTVNTLSGDTLEGEDCVRILHGVEE